MWIREDLITDEERMINLGGKTAKFGAVDRIIIHTSGGSGYGAADGKDCKAKRCSPVSNAWKWLDSLMHSS